MEMHAGSSSTSSNEDRCKPQLKAYVKVDAKRPERHSGYTPVMLSITGPSGMTRQRMPIDVVLVLHVHCRCKAPEDWHFLLQKATKLVVDKLGDNDRLAIVPSLSYETVYVVERHIATSVDISKVFSMTEKRRIVTSKRSFIVPVKPKLMLMSSENKAAASKLVESSEAMRNYTPLVTDLESAESILYGRESNEKEKRAGHIIVISNSDEDMRSLLIWRFRSVHAFGFCDAHNARTMHTIARSRESTCGILDEGGFITQAFAASIDKITSDVEPVEIKLKCNKEVVLSAIYAPSICYYVTHDKKVGTIWANARCGGTATNFIVHLSIPCDYNQTEYGSLLIVHVKYGHPPNWVNLEGQRLVPVCKGMDESKELAAELVRMEALKIIADITVDDINDSEQLHKAADALRERWSTLDEELREAAEAGLISGLAVDMQEMETRLHNNYLGLDYMLPLSHQWWPLPPLIMDKQQAIGGRLRERFQTTEITTNRPLLRLRIMAKVDAIPVPIVQRGLPVLVHVMVPVEGLAKEKRALLDLVAVLGVSCGDKEMMNKKLKLLNNAMEVVMKKLSHKDRLAIIPIQSAVAEPAPRLSQMTNQGRREYTKKMPSILTSPRKAAQKTSHWREQLKKAMCLPIATVNSSGTAACGSTNLSKSLMDAVKLLDDRQADETDRMGLIIVISDSDDISMTQTTVSSSYTIHAFSFRGADNARAMHHIASSSSGIYAIIDDDHDTVTEAFKACINKMTSTIALKTKVNIQCSRSCRATLSTIESGKFKSSIDDDKKSGSIFAGALYGGAARRFIAYVENVPEDNYESLSQMLAINLTWQHASSRVDETLDGRVEIVRDEDDGSREAVEEIVRNEEVNIITDAVSADPKTEPKDFERALGKVKELRNCCRVQIDDDDVRVRRKGPRYAFAIKEESLAGLASDKDGSLLSYVLSWLSFQGLCETAPSAPSMDRQEEGQKLPQDNLPQKLEKFAPRLGSRQPHYSPRPNRLPQ